MTATDGSIIWTELNTRDPEAARAFYAAALGWSFDESPDGMGGIYLTAKRGETLVAGIYDMRPNADLEGVPTHWFSYIGVADVDATLGAVTAAGGTVHRPVFEVPGVGRIAVIADPSGGMIGLIQPADGG